ncbi:hypothetical protein NPIL_203571 [Nephila pilipes]|uniref:Uncharacterized protein n=1 Tax=Nephila pilipes TaxID=299642 RepID=A0A8X6Q7Z2_NEPPI|nr:hypothetical protein NPIL_203571 [Nephila pilipes]
MQRPSFGWSPKCNTRWQEWDNRYAVPTRSNGAASSHRFQNSSGTRLVPLDSYYWMINEHGNTDHLDQVDHAHIQLSQSKEKEALYNNYVIVNESHSLVRIFESSIGISQRSLGNFVLLDYILIKPIFLPSLHHRVLKIVQMSFLLKPGRRGKRYKYAFVLGLLIGDERFHHPLPDHMFHRIGLFWKVDEHHDQQRKSWEGIHFVRELKND